MSSKLFLTVVLRGQPKGEGVVDLNDKGSLSEKAHKERAMVESLHLHIVQAGGLIICCCLLTRKMLAEAPRTQRERAWIERNHHCERTTKPFWGRCYDDNTSWKPPEAASRILKAFCSSEGVQSLIVLGSRFLCRLLRLVAFTKLRYLGFTFHNYAPLSYGLKNLLGCVERQCFGLRKMQMVEDAKIVIPAVDRFFRLRGRSSRPVQRIVERCPVATWHFHRHSVEAREVLQVLQAKSLKNERGRRSSNERLVCLALFLG